jgi:hypothetical protein
MVKEEGNQTQNGDMWNRLLQAGSSGPERRIALRALRRNLLAQKGLITLGTEGMRADGNAGKNRNTGT